MTTKKVIGNLNKCYSIAPLKYKGEDCILVAAEKQDPCLLFDREGNQIDTVWTQPGGVMTMVQVPESDGVFLATHKFYSPNDSKEAKIVIAEPGEEEWKIRTLTDLPFVHRFDILKSPTGNYLIACALKSGHEYKEDWTHPGKVFAAKLPDDLSEFNEDHQLELTPIKEGLTRNHGYARLTDDQGFNQSLVGSENGVFRFTPPQAEGEDWKIETLLETPASDALLMDFDEDGEDELLVMAPFHGNELYIAKQGENGMEKIWEFPDEAEFLHAIYRGTYKGKPAAFIGWRKGTRNLIAITYDPEKGYVYDVLDEDRGPANVYYFEEDGVGKLVATNRETDEIALYTLD